VVGGAVGQTDLRAAGDGRGEQRVGRGAGREFFMLRISSYLTRSVRLRRRRRGASCSTPWCGSPGRPRPVDQTASMGCSINGGRARGKAPAQPTQYTVRLP